MTLDDDPVMASGEVVRWLDGHLSQPVFVSISSSAESRGNSGAIMRGALAPGDHEVAMINPRSRVAHCWSVGLEGAFHLLEGDFVTAELLEDTLWIETRELQIHGRRIDPPADALMAVARAVGPEGRPPRA